MTPDEKTALLLCGKGKQATKLAQLASRIPGLYLLSPGDICRKPQLMLEALSDTDYQRLVLALHPGKYPLGELQAVLRKAGFDPLGVELVAIDQDLPERTLPLLLAAAARAEAFQGSRPEHAKPCLNTKLNGRALFKVNLEHYLAVPALDQQMCVAENGCTRCVRACPTNALIQVGKQVNLKVGACTACGLCLTACPTGALENPAFTPAQLEAQVRALIEAAAESRPGLLFHCVASPPGELVEGWYPVALPCTSMAPASWWLAALGLGAGGVCVTPCSGDCQTNHKGRSLGRVEFARGFLELLGAPANLVVLAQSPPYLTDGLKTLPELSTPFALAGQAKLFMALAAAQEVQAGSLYNPGSTLGRILIDPDTCTLCGRCTLNCPTSALTFEQDDGQARLDFNHRTCVACGLCLPSCPELSRKAIALEWGLDLEVLDLGRQTLHSGEQTFCLSCGKAVGSGPLMARMVELLADNPKALEMAQSYCPDCRGNQNILTAAQTEGQ